MDPALDAAPRLIVLDLDGTLVDSSDVLIEALIAQAVAEGLPPPSEAWARGRIGFPPDETWVLLGAADPSGAMARFGARVRPTLAARTVLLPGVGEALAALADAGHRLAVATTRTTASAVDTLAAQGLADAFALIAGRDLVATPKPAPDLLLHVMAELREAPARTLMVGDTTADVLAARGAGVPCWGVLGGHGDEASLRAAGAEAILSGGVAELPRALRRPAPSRRRAAAPSEGSPP